MDDDFNTGGAVGVLFETGHVAQPPGRHGQLEDPAKADPAAKAAFEEGALLAKELGQILGLFFECPAGDALAATTSWSPA